MSLENPSVVAALLDDEFRIELVDKAKELARADDRAIVKLFLTRILAEERRIHIELPKLSCAADASAALAAILADVAAGRITPNEGATLAHTLEAYARLLSLSDLEARMIAIEKSLKPT